jgi:ribonuclease D
MNKKKESPMRIAYHQNDLPETVVLKGDLAVDTETMGLNPLRDRLCVVQIADSEGSVHLVHFTDGTYNAPRLKAALLDPERTKIFHFGRFDVATLAHHLNVVAAPLFCTKIASKLVRTYTDRHGLKALCHELLGLDMKKEQQSSDWGNSSLTKDQQNYAAGDVLHLHRLRSILQDRLKRENRLDVAQRCFDFLPTRAQLDLMGWGDGDADIFHH